MASIVFDKVSVEYPIYNSSHMSLRKQLLRIGVGGLISKDKGRKLVICALNNVSFKLENGDAIGLIGHNGAGKTTLLRTMAGIYTPISGKVTRVGSTSTIIELGAGLDAELTGYENIFRMALLLGMSQDKIDAAIPGIERFTELGDFLSMPVRTYSSGMLMRLMFAVNTAVRPEILLVDEMFGTGDASFQKKAYQRMHELIEDAHIFVFASHSQDLIRKYCKRIFQLEHGSLIEREVVPGNRTGG